MEFIAQHYVYKINKQCPVGHLKFAALKHCVGSKCPSPYCPWAKNADQTLLQPRACLLLFHREERKAEGGNLCMKCPQVTSSRSVLWCKHGYLFCLPLPPLLATVQFLLILYLSEDTCLGSAVSKPWRETAPGRKNILCGFKWLWILQKEWWLLVKFFRGPWLFLGRGHRSSVCSTIAIRQMLLFIFVLLRILHLFFLFFFFNWL